jgi:hypothetical protein
MKTLKHWKVTIIANTFIHSYLSSCENRDLAIAVSTLRTLEAANIRDLSKIKIEKIVAVKLTEESFENSLP